MGDFQKVLTVIGNFCICFIIADMLVEIVVMYPIQQHRYRDGIDNLLVLLIGGIPLPAIIKLLRQLTKQQKSKTREMVSCKIPRKKSCSDKLKRLEKEVDDGFLQMDQNEIFVEVFGPERHGRVRGYGDGITPTELFGRKSSIVSDLAKKLEESERKREESDIELQKVKEKMERMEEIMTQILEGRLNS